MVNSIKTELIKMTDFYLKFSKTELIKLMTDSDLKIHLSSHNPVTLSVKQFSDINSIQI